MVLAYYIYAQNCAMFRNPSEESQFNQTVVLGDTNYQVWITASSGQHDPGTCCTGIESENLIFRLPLLQELPF